MTEEPPIPRLPEEINKALRPLLEKMNDYSKGKVRKGSEMRAFEIQRLKRELEGSMKYHIGLCPDPGKLLLIKQFP